MTTENEELERARTALQAAGCDFGLLSSLANVTYVSGYEVPMPVGAHVELAYGMPAALFSARDDANWLIVSDGAAPVAREESRLSELLVFDGFDSFRPTDSGASYLEQIEAALRQGGLAGTEGTLGVEVRFVPLTIKELLTEKFPRLRLLDIGHAMQQARLIKTEREINLLRRAAHVGDVAHEALADLVTQPGRTEFEMWGEITARMYRTAGRDIPISGELVTGPRTSQVEYPNGPRERATELGDAVLMDISGRVGGYWFDCTNTHVVGHVEPGAHQKKFAKASQAACEAAMSALRPGTRACDAWTAAEAAFKKYSLPVAHYAGHQIGVTVNELPRLVPYDDTSIQAGMVFSVEPGAYEGPGGTFGARSEKMVLVTASGPEIMSAFEWGI